MPQDAILPSDDHCMSYNARYSVRLEHTHGDPDTIDDTHNCRACLVDVERWLDDRTLTLLEADRDALDMEGWRG